MNNKKSLEIARDIFEQLEAHDCIEYLTVQRLENYEQIEKKAIDIIQGALTHDSSVDTVHNFLNEQVYNLQQKADPNNVLDLGSSASFFQFSDGSSFNDLIENIKCKLAEYSQSIN